MALNPNSFRRGAIAAAAIAGASLLMTFSAAAQDMKGSPACAPIQDGVKALQCEVKQLDKRIDNANKRSDEADRTGAEAQAVTDCVQFLLAGVKNGTIPKDEILKKASGKVNDTNACPIAKQYGFGRKAEANDLSLR